MPIYEYRCTKCGHRFEILQKVSDPPRSKCEACGGKSERLVSSPAIQFKGSGWYITDYARKGSNSETSKTEPSSESGSGESGTSSSDKSSSEKAPSKKPKEKAGSRK